ncbi:MAG: hypothetical protein A2W36_01825 [Chloroflexi bacterium RBG_16_58_14]|nr:MAG: hypothetical protein A2W36_01825 [Chloroflexi bacterium RBG_16_58_14]
MKRVRFAVVICMVLSMLGTACAAGVPSQAPAAQVPHLETTPQSTVPPATPIPPGGLSPDAIASLNSLQQVDDYPLYTMLYVGETTFSQLETLPRVETAVGAPLIFTPQSASSPDSWGCSLFAALAEGEDRLYGRNFDWEFSPALLLFTSPPDGYASVSMVDIAYLGFGGSEAQGLVEQPLEKLQNLLQAPAWPFDGMNSQGLAIGMAAVPDGNVRPDPDKATLDSLMVMREILDHAADVAQALEIFNRYNIDMGGGPPLHYLLADSTGEAALVEFYQGELRVIPNEEPYHLATNFLLSAAGGFPAGQCWRYDAVRETLEAERGSLTAEQAIQMLANVAQDSTQWSVVYDMTSLEVRVVAGQQYEQVHCFELK